MAREHNDDARNERDRQVRRVLWIELFCNLFVAAIKGSVGALTGSLSIAADAIHSAVDSGANLIGLFVLGKSSAPPDKGHPYGHRKFELVASAILGLAIAVAGVQLAIQAVGSLYSRSAPPTPSLLAFALVATTLLVNIAVAVYEAKKAKELSSHFLEADAAHTASDVLVTLTVLAGYGAAYLGLAWGDSLGALVVVIVILRVAWSVLSKNVTLLAGSSVIDEESLRKTILSVEGVKGCHRIRSHGLPDHVIVDFHLLADGNLSLRAGHALAHQVEERICKHHPEVSDLTIHVEPAGDPVEAL